MSLVLFDLDGTLVDSAPGIHASVRHAAATVGIPEPTPAQLRRLIGPPFPAAFRDELGVDHATGQAMIEAYREVYAGGLMFEVTRFDGVFELLTGLADRGDRLAITTSKPVVHAREIVAHIGLGDLFAGHVYGASLDGSIEGKAAVVALARAAHDGPITGLVGDRHHDVEGARVHGLPCVGVTWGFGDRAELLAAGAAAVVDDPAEVTAALDGLDGLAEGSRPAPIA